MYNILHNITSIYPSLKDAERRVAEFILSNPAEVILLSMRGIAEKTNVSDNTVLRFCRSCGFSGFLDFKSALIPNLVMKGHMFEFIATNDPITIQQKKILGNLDSTIRATYNSISQKDIELVAEKIANSSRIVVVGLGASFGVAQILSTSLLTMGKFSVAVSDKINIERTGNTLTKDAIVIGLSHSGETEEVLMALRRCKESECFSIMITNNIAIQQETFIDVVFLTHTLITNITGYFFSLPRIAQLLIIELVLSRVPAFIVDKQKGA